MDVEIKVEFFPPLEEIAQSKEYKVYNPGRKSSLASWALKALSRYLVESLKIDMSTMAGIVRGLSSTLTRIASGDEDWDGNDLVTQRRAERIAASKAERAAIVGFFCGLIKVVKAAAKKERR